MLVVPFKEKCHVDVANLVGFSRLRRDRWSTEAEMVRRVARETSFVNAPGVLLASRGPFGRTDVTEMTGVSLDAGPMAPSCPGLFHFTQTGRTDSSPPFSGREKGGEDRFARGANFWGTLYVEGLAVFPRSPSGYRLHTTALEERTIFVAEE